MKVRFTKMHGTGNDYIFVNCMTTEQPIQLPELARSMSDRHFGVGGDGLILICQSDVADARMRMFNSDGSEAEMCGNGLRCLARYLFDHDIVRKTEMTIETERGLLPVHLTVSNTQVGAISISMGEPILESKLIPTTLDGDPPIEAELFLSSGTQHVTCVSMGNPHTVIFLPKVDDHHVMELGPAIENHSCFPQRTNVEFVEVIARDHLRVRIWERGSGETLSCGTGACASVIAACIAGHGDRTARVDVLGGTLSVHWRDDNNVILSGRAEKVFEGEWFDGVGLPR